MIKLQHGCNWNVYPIFLFLKFTNYIKRYIKNVGKTKQKKNENRITIWDDPIKKVQH
jgi:uncharacterized protein (DUF1015 family)